MGKSKESKDINRDLSSQYQYQNNRRGNINPYWNPQIQQSSQNAESDRGSLVSSLGGLSDFANNFSGPDTSAMSGDASAYRDFAKGNTETGQFYRNLMNTGGYSEGELGDIRSAGTRIIPSFFNSLKNQMRTAQGATGGYSPGYSAGAAKMARDAAHQSQDASLDTELGISDRVRQGKLTGAGGLERAFMGGMGGASQLDQAIAQMQLQGQGMKGNLLGDVAQGYGSLYGQDQNMQMQQEAMKLRELGMSDEMISNIMTQRMQYNPNQSWFDKYGMPILNAGLGVASSLWNPTGGKSASQGYNSSMPHNYALPPNGITKTPWGNG